MVISITEKTFRQVYKRDFNKTKSFLGYRDISLADRKDLGDRDNFCPHMNATFPFSGKTFFFILYKINVTVENFTRQAG